MEKRGGGGFIRVVANNLLEDTWSSVSRARGDSGRGEGAWGQCRRGAQGYAWSSA